MTDYEKFAAVRRPLPDWWVTVRRERTLSAAEIVLLAEREKGGSKRYTVPVSVLCALAKKDTLSTVEVEAVWGQVENRFLSAARRRFIGENDGPNTLGVADI